MSQFCSACDRELCIAASSEDEQINVICECGVINQVECTNVQRRHLNVALIKSKMREILTTDEMFAGIDNRIKEEIETYASKIGTHVVKSLKCFAIVFIESRNLLNFNCDYIIKKKQRKNAIQILVNISPNKPTIFVRTPLTYMQIYANDYTQEDRSLYTNITECLLFLNACNKKNMQSIYEKIHKIVIEVKRNNKSEYKLNLKVANLLNIIRFIAYNNITIKELTNVENRIFSANITSLK